MTFCFFPYIFHDSIYMREVPYIYIYMHALSHTYDMYINLSQGHISPAHFSPPHPTNVYIHTYISICCFTL